MWPLTFILIVPNCFPFTWAGTKKCGRSLKNPRWYRLIHVHAAVYMQRRTGNVARGRRSNERDNRRDLIGTSQSAQRHVLDQVLLLLAGEGTRHVGLYESRCNTIDSDIAAAHLTRKGLAEAEYPRFGRCIIGLTQITCGPDYGRNIDDASIAGLHHRAQHAAAQTEYRFEIGFQNIVPLLIFHPDEQIIARDACVIHQYGDISKFVMHRFENAFNLGSVVYIQHHPISFDSSLSQIMTDSFGTLRGGGSTD